MDITYFWEKYGDQILLNTFLQRPLVNFNVLIDEEILNTCYSKEEVSRKTKLLNEQGLVVDPAKPIVVVAKGLAEEEQAIGRIITQFDNLVYGFIRDIYPAMKLHGDPNCAFGNVATPLKKVAVLGLPRSGTTFLASLFTKNHFGLCTELIRYPELTQLTERGGRLTEMLDKWELLSTERFSFKITIDFLYLIEKYTDITAQQVLEELHQRNYSFVFLDRKDPIDIALSMYKAEKSGVYHHFTTDKKTIEKVVYLPVEIEACYQKVCELKDWWARVLQLSNVPMVSIDYESLTRDTGKTLLAMFKSIGIDQNWVLINSDLVKVNDPTTTQMKEAFQKYLTNKPEEPDKEV